MHYYQFNIADYRKDTVHLTAIEHYIYRSLIDWYYLDEMPIPKITQVVMRRLSIGLENEPNLLNVLNDFFKLDENGWNHHRINQEIIEYRAKAIKNKANGKKGGRPAKLIAEPTKTQVVIDGLPDANPSESEINPNQEPLTINHKPLLNTSDQKPSSAKALTENLPIPDFVDIENWKAFIEVRKGLKAKNTIQAMKALITQLKKLVAEGFDADEVVLQSIRSSWKDLYPIKQSFNSNQPTSYQQSITTAARSIFKPEYIAEQTNKIIEVKHEPIRQIA